MKKKFKVKVSSLYMPSTTKDRMQEDIDNKKSSVTTRPIEVAKIDKNRFMIVDGNHRVLEAKLSGKTEIDATLACRLMGIFRRYIFLEYIPFTDVECIPEGDCWCKEIELPSIDSSCENTCTKKWFDSINPDINYSPKEIKEIINYIKLNTQIIKKNKI